MKEFRQRFGKKLKELRTLAGLSQAELANIMGYSEKTISYWENGHNPIKFDNILILSKALGVPAYKLFIFSELDKYNNEDVLELFDAMTEKERNVILQVINSILMLR